LKLLRGKRLRLLFVPFFLLKLQPTLRKIQLMLVGARSRSFLDWRRFQNARVGFL
jgi:predicted nucleotidyltransferase